MQLGIQLGKKLVMINLTHLGQVRTSILEPIKPLSTQCGKKVLKQHAKATLDLARTRTSQTTLQLLSVDQLIALVAVNELPVRKKEYLDQGPMKVH